MKVRLAVIAGCAMLAPIAHSARAQNADDFFGGKQLSIIIGSTAGGGYDAYARLLARHIGAHLSGNPTIVPKNMPGAGGLAVANYLYNKAPKDGTEIGIVQNGVAFEKLFQTLSPGGKSALFDAEKFGWIGSMAQTVFVTVTWHDAPARTIEEARAKQIILGASGPSSDSSILAVMSNNLLGTKFKVVHGYDGAAAVDLAMENGEIQGEAGKDWTTLTSMDCGSQDQHHGPDGDDAASRAAGGTHGARPCAHAVRPADHGAGFRQVRNVAALHGAPWPSDRAACIAAPRIRGHHARSFASERSTASWNGDQAGGWARRGRTKKFAVLNTVLIFQLKRRF
jgi:hypothetical protein